MNICFHDAGKGDAILRDPFHPDHAFTKLFIQFRQLSIEWSHIEDVRFNEIIVFMDIREIEPAGVNECVMVGDEKNG